jgi:hypothetical protein
MSQTTETLITHKSVYKYKLSVLIAATARPADTRSELRQYVGITRQTLSDDMNVLLSSSREIPKARIIAYETFFKIPENSLINE